MIGIITSIIITSFIYGGLLLRQQAVSKRLLKQRDEARQVVEDIRQNRMLYFSHPRFKLVQAHINKILYPRDGK